MVRFVWLGYKEALKKAGISYSEGLVFESKYTYEDGYALAERLISSNATAAVVTGDELAAGVLNGLADRVYQYQKNLKSY